ncbi:MAG: tRNA 2-thiouridine(34) synthase MnmA [Candidatus Avelusimicrobium sp.]|uniref:tRNA 2-thiouridine(34) synthase MnmA n=1 Tax=Candidatus Avelusimicrobium sp. TaxID=3048833 RepID=UPI003F02DC1C
MMEKETVLVGLSGGVDSAASAVMLKEQGYRVIGATMQIWDPSLPVPKGEYQKNACLSPEKEDLEEVRRIAEKIGIEYIVVDCRQEYRQTVLDNFRLEYACGRTPNPCVLCNSLIKFGVLPSAAKAQGVAFDKFATGHYARVAFDKISGKYLLKKAADLSRDQSYFLHRLKQPQLASVLFPLGEKTKPEIREIARKAGLAVADKEDSQDFYCGDYNDLLNFPNKEGDIVTKDGKKVARHHGIWGYTIGKRKGLGISGFATPMYVVGIDAQKNQVIIGPKADLYSDRLEADNISWVAGEPPAQTFDCEIKIRNLHHPAKARVTVRDDGSLEAKFEEPQMSITAGQSAVLYQGDVVLGGGMIR